MVGEVFRFGDVSVLVICTELTISLPCKVILNALFFSVVMVLHIKIWAGLSSLYYVYVFHPESR